MLINNHKSKYSNFRADIMNEVLKTIKSRRSIRRYTEEQIKDGELDILLEAAIYAPTGIMTGHGILQLYKTKN